MRRILLVLVLALAVVAPAGAWTWPADGVVLQPFSFDRELPKAAGQHRGIDVGGAARSGRARAGDGRRLVRRHGADERQVRDDRDRRRLVGDAHPPRLHRRDQGRVGRRGRRRRDDRSERRARGERAARPSRRPQDDDEYGYVDPLALLPRAAGSTPSPTPRRGRPRRGVAGGDGEPGAAGRARRRRRADGSVAPAASRAGSSGGPTCGEATAAGRAAAGRRPAGCPSATAPIPRPRRVERTAAVGVEPARAQTAAQPAPEPMPRRRHPAPVPAVRCRRRPRSRRVAPCVPSGAPESTAPRRPRRRARVRSTACDRDRPLTGAVRGTRCSDHARARRRSPARRVGHARRRASPLLRGAYTRQRSRSPNASRAPRRRPRDRPRRARPEQRDGPPSRPDGAPAEPAAIRRGRQCGVRGVDAPTHGIAVRVCSRCSAILVALAVAALARAPRRPLARPPRIIAPDAEWGQRRSSWRLRGRTPRAIGTWATSRASASRRTCSPAITG